VECAKLAAKNEAGATFAQTQPVYDVEALERFLVRPEARAVSVWIGLIPLQSLKQTLFFANEVPGIVVPESIQGRMRRAHEKGRDFEKAEGLAIARELAAAIAKLASGLHVMPMGRYTLVSDILSELPRPATRRNNAGA
jgi:5,10-methylenetetrahydrofolate reductase